MSFCRNRLIDQQNLPSRAGTLRISIAGKETARCSAIFATPATISEKTALKFFKDDFPSCAPVSSVRSRIRSAPALFRIHARHQENAPDLQRGFAINTNRQTLPTMVPQCQGAAPTVTNPANYDRRAVFQPDPFCLSITIRTRQRDGSPGPPVEVRGTLPLTLTCIQWTSFGASSISKNDQIALRGFFRSRWRYAAKRLQSCPPRSNSAGLLPMGRIPIDNTAADGP